MSMIIIITRLKIILTHERQIDMNYREGGGGYYEETWKMIFLDMCEIVQMVIKEAQTKNKEERM